MIKTFTFCAIGILFVKIAFSNTADSVVTISSAIENYQFVYNTKTASVEIKQKLTTTYIANNFQASVPVVQGYNNHFTITNVECKVDGRIPWGFKPTYTYYGSDDIFYSDQKICYFPLIIPKKGGLGVVTFAETVDDPRYFTNIGFSESYVVNQKQIVVKVPRWMKVELKEYNFNGFNITKSTQYISGEDADVITFTIKNLPATKQESNSPGPTYLYPHLMVLCKSATVGGKTFTYFNTLDDQYKWYHSLIKNTIADQGAITAKAKELTGGQTNDIEKIKAIFYYVQDNIRYIAFEDGMAGFKPENADEVLRKKYGDCKGMANLTKALLTAAGYDARLCWLGTKHIAYDYQTPSLAVDNHMICALNYEGKTYFLDATESYLGFDEYAERIQGRQILIEDGEKYQLTKVPVALAGQNANAQISKLSITAGAITGTVNYVWKGEDKEEILTGINSIKREKTEDAMVRYLSGDNNDYKVTNLALSGTSNPDKDLTATYALTTKNGISLFGKTYYIDLDNTKEFINGAIKTDERRHDYWFSHRQNLTRNAELAIPQGYKVASLPAALKIVNPNYEFHVQYVPAGDKVTYKKSIIIKNTHLPKTGFAQWNADIEQLVKTYNDALTIKPISE
ncbi:MULTISPECIES: transglutaminase-like domain-containing protein [unclassified Mucilaginibacter]|uniref:transglutaminase-like domain-containing protein n=1 Tax=unclassified Mucilaginibacter TaxID=2617802 RepID=UPI002AC8BC81|nr:MULTISPECIES: transglutaminase-like domain-containing protein [unclassified Mucilaginibacter]MEB0260154.1 transglutaminase-like domain-containing protein [Mucilaginibacter sp. 10I4]MEB0279125.1 transglutaminase-like domain-containing protein [Mucilaginibacter sp. 10B2]MEB0302092.1 transglutaminase-like domain-containing protein [Mucilaginibacter sp. 5C4]WPX22303.1 transglutaminase-like domain-containing protein [Mucilaginibacter sp. 5C4]